MPTTLTKMQGRSRMRPKTKTQLSSLCSVIGLNCQNEVPLDMSTLRLPQLLLSDCCSDTFEEVCPASCHSRSRHFAGSRTKVCSPLAQHLTFSGAKHKGKGTKLSDTPLPWTAPLNLASRVMQRLPAFPWMVKCWSQAQPMDLLRFAHSKAV